MSEIFFFASSGKQINIQSHTYYKEGRSSAMFIALSPPPPSPLYHFDSIAFN